MHAFPLGGDTNTVVNLANGNALVRMDDLFIPGHGFNIAVSYAYNTLENGARDGMGRGWRLGVTDVTTGTDYSAAGIDANQPLVFAQEFQEDPDDGVLRLVGHTLDFTDADGTTHRFVSEIGDTGRWHSPPGVNLAMVELRQPITGLAGIPAAEGLTELVGYELYRPDGLRYLAEYIFNGWRITQVRNGAGDALHYRYDQFGDTLGQVRLTGIGNNRSGPSYLDPPTQFSTAMRQRVQFNYNTAGQLDTVDALLGESAANGDGTLVPVQRTTQLQYSTDGQLARVVQNVGVTVEDAAGQAVSGQRTTRFAYDGQMRLAAVTDPRGHVSTMAYYADGRFKSLQDRKGDVDDGSDNLWTVAYNNLHDGSGVTATATVTAPGPGATGTLKTTYTISDRVRQSDAPRIEGANILAITDAGTDLAAVATTHEWRDNHLVAVIDALGNRTETSYDRLGNVVSVEVPALNTAEALAATNLPVDAHLGGVRSDIDYEYRRRLEDVDGCELAENDPPGLALRGYDEDCYAYALPIRVGAAASTGGSQTRYTTFTYKNSRIKTVTQHDDHVDLAAFIDDPASTVDGTDRQVTYDYYGTGEFGPLRRVVGPRPQDVVTYGVAGDADHFGYDRNGMASTIIDAAGNGTGYRYDPYGNVVKMIEPGTGAAWITRYDGRGWPIETQDPDGDVVAFVHDLNGNRTHTITPGHGPGDGSHVTEVTYDFNDRPRVTSTPDDTDTDRLTSTVNYHPNGLVDWIKDPLGLTTVTTYWPNGRVKAVQTPGADGTSQVSQAYYDIAGRVRTAIAPRTALYHGVDDRPTTTYTYSPAGLVSTATTTSPADPDNGVATVHTVYNAHGEVVSVRGPRNVDGEVQHSQTVYDRFGQAERTRRYQGHGEWLTQTYTYDLAGRLQTSTRPLGNAYLGPVTSGVALAPEPATETSSYSYDVRGLLASMSTTRSGVGAVADHRVTYAYDVLGRQTSRTDHVGPLADGQVVRTTTTGYNPDGSLRSMVASDAATGETWATCNFPVGSPSGGFGPSGRLLTSRTVTGTAGCDSGTTVRTSTYGYDAAGRPATMTEVLDVDGTAVSRTQEYDYHANGAWQHLRFGPTGATLRDVDYELGAGGSVARMTDWSGRAVAFDRTPGGAVQTMVGGPATAVRSTSDVGHVFSERTFSITGQLTQLDWWRTSTSDAMHTPFGGLVRQHLGIGYDAGGLRLGEDVRIVRMSRSSWNFGERPPGVSAW